MASASNKTGESTIYDGENVMVEPPLPMARPRLVKITGDATLREAARLLCAGADLIVVRGICGAAVGVTTKTDIVDRINEWQGAACMIAADSR